jgi:hypothetical protein
VSPTRPPYTAIDLAFFTVDNGSAPRRCSPRLGTMPEPHHDRAVTRRIGAAVAVAGVMALALSGCVGAPAPTPTPSASASAKPIFASDEEALAAAEAAYSTFEAVSHDIASDSGRQPERIETVATPTYAPELVQEFAQYRELEIRADGSVKLDSFSLVQHTENDSSSEVVIYVCRDVSGVRILDANGADLTPADRAARTPLIASLRADGPGEKLLVDGVELWSGEDFC